MGYHWLRLIGAFVIWICSGFKKKYSDFFSANTYAILVGIIIVFVLVWLVYGVFGKDIRCLV